ncbi:MAG: hypothetical protein GXX86_12930 [Propionibacterium sp.]|nr:hypothetical protein [Propionibacterium sp.]
MLTGIGYVLWTALAWGVWPLMALSGSVVLASILLESWIRAPVRTASMRPVAIVMPFLALAAAVVGIGYLVPDHTLPMADYLARFGPLFSLPFPIISAVSVLRPHRPDEGDPDD